MACLIRLPKCRDGRSRWRADCMGRLDAIRQETNRQPDVSRTASRRADDKQTLPAKEQALRWIASTESDRDKGRQIIQRREIPTIGDLLDSLLMTHRSRQTARAESSEVGDRVSPSAKLRTLESQRTDRCRPETLRTEEPAGGLKDVTIKNTLFNPAFRLPECSGTRKSITSEMMPPRFPKLMKHEPRKGFFTLEEFRSLLPHLREDLRPYSPICFYWMPQRRRIETPMGMG